MKIVIPNSKKKSEIDETKYKFEKLDEILCRLTEIQVEDVQYMTSEYDDEKIIKCDIHPLILAAHIAYSDHLGLTLTPDIIWNCITNAVAVYISVYSEELRKMIINDGYKNKIEISNYDFIMCGKNPWNETVEEIMVQIKEYTNDAVDLLEADFTTTTEISRVASQIIIMDHLEINFEYNFSTMCCIPEIRLNGEKSDWERVKMKTNQIINIIPEFEEWIYSLNEVLDQFVDAYDEKIDKKFWDDIYKHDTGNNDYLISGWLISFFPFLKDGKKNTFCWDSKTWKLTRELDDFEMTKYMGLSIYEFNHHLNIVPFSWKYYGIRHNMLLIGGLVGVHLNTIDSYSTPVFGYGIMGPKKNSDFSDEEKVEAPTHKNSLFDSIDYDDNQKNLEKATVYESYDAEIQVKGYEKLENELSDSEKKLVLNLKNQDLEFKKGYFESIEINELNPSLQESIVSNMETSVLFSNENPINEFAIDNNFNIEDERVEKRNMNTEDSDHITSDTSLQKVISNEIEINNMIQYSTINASLSYCELDNDKKLQELVDNLVNESDDVSESRSRRESIENHSSKSYFSDSLQGSTDIIIETNNLTEVNSIDFKKDLIEKFSNHQNSDDHIQTNSILEDNIDLIQTQSDKTHIESTIEINSFQNDLFQDKIVLQVNQDNIEISKTEAVEENKIYDSLELTQDSIEAGDNSESEDNNLTLNELKIDKIDFTMTESENDLQISHNGTIQFGVGSFEHSKSENEFDEDNNPVSKNEFSEDEKTELDEVRFDTQYQYFMQQLSKNESGHELDSINESDEYELEELRIKPQELEAIKLKSNSVQIESDTFYSSTQSQDYFVTGDEELATSKTSEPNQKESDELSDENEEFIDLNKENPTNNEKNEANILEDQYYNKTRIKIVIDECEEMESSDDENKKYEDSQEYKIEEVKTFDKDDNLEQNNNEELDSSAQGSFYYSVTSENESNFKIQKEIQNDINRQYIQSIKESKESVEIINEIRTKCDNNQRLEESNEFPKDEFSIKNNLIIIASDKNEEVSIRVKSLKLEESIKISSSSNLAENKQEDPERLIAPKDEQVNKRKNATKMSCFEKMLNCCEIL